MVGTAAMGAEWDDMTGEGYIDCGAGVEKSAATDGDEDDEEDDDEEEVCCCCCC